MKNDDSVCAVVVTFNRLSMLRRTLQCLEMQTKQINKIIVVNNASIDETSEFLIDLQQRNAVYEIHNLDENLGGSGGFAYGMRKALERGSEWVWIMDDDAFAAPDCLARLLRNAEKSEVLIPVQVNERGEYYGSFDWEMGPRTKTIDRGLNFQPAPLFTFVGPLFKRGVIEAVGLPDKSYFICFDDTEYSMRIQSLGYSPISVHDAVIYHSYGQGEKFVRKFGLTSMRSTAPAWKTYYNTRNEFYLSKYLSNDNMTAYKLHLVKSWIRGAIGELLFDEAGFDKIRFRLLGIRDAFLGRTGKRVSP